MKSTNHSFEYQSVAASVAVCVVPVTTATGAVDAVNIMVFDSLAFVFICVFVVFSNINTPKIYNISKMSDSEESAISGTPPEIRFIANETYETLVPQKSKGKYELAYRKLMEWASENKVKTISENVLLAYFKRLSDEMKPSTLWTTYSMIKSMLNIKNNTDISKYAKLQAFLKLKSSGYKSKKSKVLTAKEINTFLLEAPDDKYLFTKVS